MGFEITVRVGGSDETHRDSNFTSPHHTPYVTSQYENRAWCRVEMVVGHAVVQPPLASEPQPFERYRLELFVRGDPERAGTSGGALVEDLDGVRVVHEVTPAGSRSPALNPGKGVLSVESDRPPLVLISHILGYKSDVEGPRRRSLMVGAVEVEEEALTATDTAYGAYEYIKVGPSIPLLHLASST